MVLPDNSLVNSTLGMINGDIFAQKLAGNQQGAWGIASSLTLATLDALSQDYSLTTIMANFERWYQEGAFTAEGELQTASPVTKKALDKYLANPDPYEAGGRELEDNTNGALLRITPVVMYLEANYGHKFVTKEPAMLILHQIGGLTHNNPRGLIALGIYAMLLNQLMAGHKLIEAIDAAVGLAYEYYAQSSLFADELEAFERLNTPDFSSIKLDELVASADVIDTLETTIWVLLNSNSYQDALNVASQIKGEPDCIVALVGAVAGIMYGHAELPKSWLDDDEYSQVKAILAKAVVSGNFDFEVED